MLPGVTLNVHARDALQNPPLRVERVSRSFGGLRAVDGISFDVAAGEHLAVLGPNGAGKSTLFNVICGDLLPDSGRVLLNGEDVTSLALHHRVRRGLGRTYQTSSVFAGLSVAEHIALALRGPISGRLALSMRSRERREVARSTERLVALVGLDGRSAAPASELSHGELRQLEIGMALAPNPDVILLDEPAAGLSADERTRLTELLLNLSDTVATVLVEHDMDVALTVADRVIVLESGSMIAKGSPSQIESDPLVRAVYLGEQHKARSARSSGPRAELDR
ncbi:MAG: ABC transporter ATP-binding protein [Acidimicrobiaceae bacterium]|nr:ABC transporter ATP-binding protein [Acidimicrobiaceae bacterium]MDE0664050.1 ABC transporter ATP-binding protein [Acidimicrobiaceae bacterium]